MLGRKEKMPIAAKPIGKGDRIGLHPPNDKATDLARGGMPPELSFSWLFRGGNPPGLTLTPPPVPISPQESKRKMKLSKGPTPRLTDEEFNGVSRALDIWALLENPDGNKHISDTILLGGPSMNCARQGKMFLLESHRAGNFTHSNRAPLDEWARRIHYGERKRIFDRSRIFRRYGPIQAVAMRSISEREEVQTAVVVYKWKEGIPICLGEVTFVEY